MALRTVLTALARIVAENSRLRERVARALLRADAIVPFGRGLMFDPRTWVIKQTEYGFRIWVALGERSISREIMLDRYEPHEVAFVRESVKRGDHVVDVGANIGFYTALLCTLVGPAGRVTAFEPLDAAADALERTLLENGFTDRVVLHRVALDERAGNVDLRHAPVTVNLGAAYLAPRTAVPAGHIDTTVPARTLDEIVGAQPCAFVKLDAEGAEPRILTGAARTLATARPIVLAELNPTLLERVGGRSATDVIAQMHAYGYVARALGGTRTAIERYDDAASINVVFTPDRIS